MKKRKSTKKVSPFSIESFARYAGNVQDILDFCGSGVWFHQDTSDGLEYMFNRHPDLKSRVSFYKRKGQIRMKVKEVENV